MQRDKGWLRPEQHLEVALTAGDSLDAVVEPDGAVDTIALLQPREPGSKEAVKI